MSGEAALDSAAPRQCRTRTLLSLRVPHATEVTTAVAGTRALVAASVHPELGSEHVRVWMIELSTGELSASTLDEEVLPRAFGDGDDLVLTAWRGTRGTRLHRYPRGAAPRQRDLPSLGAVAGAVEGPSGSLLLWHDRPAMAAGNRVATLTRVHADGRLDSTDGTHRYRILGVLAGATSTELWLMPPPRTQDYVENTAIERLSPTLTTPHTTLVGERLGEDCRLFTTRPSLPPQGRLVCASGATWRLEPGAVTRGRAFGSGVLAAAEGDVPVAARHDSQRRQLVVESFEGSLASFDVDGGLFSAGLAVDGGELVVAFVHGAHGGMYRQAAERYLEVQAIDCRRGLTRRVADPK